MSWRVRGIRDGGRCSDRRPRERVRPARQPPPGRSSSIGSLATTTDLPAARCAARAWIRRVCRSKPAAGAWSPRAGPVRTTRGTRIAQRPQVAGGAQQDVEGVDGQVLGHPADRLTQAGTDITAVAANRAEIGRTPAPNRSVRRRVQRRHRPATSRRARRVPRPRRCGRTSGRPGERVGIGYVQRASGGVANMGQERCPRHLVRLAVKGAIVPRRHRLFAQFGLSGGVEHPEAGPVRVASTLRGEVVRCVEQPEKVAVTARRPACRPKSRHISGPTTMR